MPDLLLSCLHSIHRRPPPGPLHLMSSLQQQAIIIMSTSLLHQLLLFGTEIRLLVNAMNNMLTILKIALLLRQSGPDEPQNLSLIDQIPLLKSS